MVYLNSQIHYKPKMCIRDRHKLYKNLKHSQEEQKQTFRRCPQRPSLDLNIYKLIVNIQYKRLS